ncbi:MAG: hypothetical protein IT364_12920 [Candidatus Hydrogenedentes bacterium]|nr:hypothetical protein [Candidatus Hydrogenedentota bacterium]
MADLDEVEEKQALQRSFAVAERDLKAKDIAEAIGWDESSYSRFKRNGYASQDRRKGAIDWLASHGYWPPPPLPDLKRPKTSPGPVFHEAASSTSDTAEPAFPMEKAEPPGFWLWIDAAHLEGRADLVQRLREIQDQQDALLEEWNSSVAEKTAILAQLKNIYIARSRRSGPQPKPVDPPKRGEPFT